MEDEDYGKLFEAIRKAKDSVRAGHAGSNKYAGTVVVDTCWLSGTILYSTWYVYDTPEIAEKVARAIIDAALKEGDK